MNIDSSISLYVHMPWCIRKCPYCDFNSHQINSSIPEKEYITNLILDLKEDIKLLRSKKNISTIFFGGGTPSLISPDAYKILIDNINAIIHIESNCEITMETNPGTTEHADFNLYASAGINRISLGVQSFDNLMLRKLGRIHSSKESLSAIQKINDSKISELNIDIMHGLPDQSLSMAMQDLNQAIELKPTHISWYQLTLEPGTNFYHKPPKLPAGDVLDEIYESGNKLLQHHDFIQYEISAYSKNGVHQCRHNNNYWQYGDYLGIGAGAHGKITNLEKNEITRTNKVRQPKFYLDKNKSFCSKISTVSPQERPFEFMLNSLRLTKGFTIKEFEKHTMLSIQEIDSTLDKAIAMGYLELEQDRYRPTKAGMLFYNDAVGLFL